MKKIKIQNLEMANNLPFVLIAGPCLLESKIHAYYMITQIAEITKKLDIPFIYKTSFDKANRSSYLSERGDGIEEAKLVFEELRNIAPVVTDVHEPWHCDKLRHSVDMLQIPAFLCRQTDLLTAAGDTKLPVNVKKGQFLAPWEMDNVVKKIERTGNKNILLTERGSSFGYNTLVVDYRSFPIMASSGYPVCMDATHAVQSPGGKGTSSGGDRTFVPALAKAGVVQGIAAVFMEVHDNPDAAPSDGPNMVPLNELEILLTELKAIDKVVKGY